MAFLSSDQIRTKQSIPTPAMKNCLVGYCTDIEGNLDYWRRYIEISKVLEQRDEGVTLKDNCHFVYGGDVCDRGVGDIRIMTDIVRLKMANPDRVHIILGNRDVNKMRLLTELQEEFIGQPAHTYWTGDIKQTGDLTASARLRAIFEQTMGAPLTFEYRRQELIALEKDSTDVGVVRSFMDSVYPDGCMLQFLVHGSLAVKLGDVLFIHGGTHENSVGWVPPSSQSQVASPSDLGGSKAPDVDSWCEQLESFRRGEMEEFVSYSKAVAGVPIGEGWSVYGDMNWSEIGGYGHAAPGSRLLQYGMGWMPDKSVNPTMIYDNFLEDGAPKSPSAVVTQFLASSGIAKLIVGHQPHGDAPVIIDNGTIQILTGDTSYATGVKWGAPDMGREDQTRLEALQEAVRSSGQSGGGYHFAEPSDPNDTRGIAVSEIVFKFRENCQHSRTFVHGCLSNGLEYNFELPSGQSNTILGKVTEDQWWIKAKMHSARTRPESAGMMAALRASMPCLRIGQRSARVSSSDDEDDSSLSDEDIYLVCLSKGRDVFNSLERAGDIKRRIS